MNLKSFINSKVRALLEGVLEKMTKGAGSEQLETHATISKPNRSLRPTRTFEDFFEHLKRLNFRPSICIDVGAATGTPSIYRAFPDALHVAFEPLPDFQGELKATLQPYKHIIRKCALSDSEGQTTLLRHNDLFGSSIMHSRDNQDADVVETRKSTLDVELSGIDLTGPVILKTDCQGSDLLVLQGAAETLETCDVVIVEASLFRFWGPHQADVFDIICYMQSRGFALYDLLDGLYRPRDAALGQIDLVFVKERGHFRKDHYW